MRILLNCSAVYFICDEIKEQISKREFPKYRTHTDRPLGLADFPDVIKMRC